MSLAADDESHSDLEYAIADLEARLQEAKQRLVSRTSASRSIPSSAALTHNGTIPNPLSSSMSQSSAHHYLLLLSDSALPLGSFAFSSGLESYKAHNTGRGTSSFSTFLPLSLSSYASTTLPFVLAAHRNPPQVADLDDALDAAVICTVGRRASMAQGRALLAVWEKSFAVGVSAEARQTIGSLRALPSAATTTSSAGGATDVPSFSAHLAPLFGAICNLLGLTLHQTAYVFMLSHVKALVSAGVRAAMLGPYVAQKILASAEVQGMITAMVEREWETAVEKAGQSVPVMDLWVGRHEVLYSRIFNS
ncbi:urease [Xylariales sp. AK1849]|nr:urease [Xylariales sp. AK1849]